MCKYLNTVLNYHAVPCGYKSAIYVVYQWGLLLLDPGRHNSFQLVFTCSPACLSKFADYMPFTVVAVVDIDLPSKCGCAYLAPSREIF
jgi:hypothetical protein